MKPTTKSFYEAAVQRAIERIAESLDDALDLHTLAIDACLSPFHFHRVFRGMVGETPLGLTRRLRLERAAWQLLRRDTPVTEIAFDAGFETHEAFTRAFRAAYNESPSRFRVRRPPHVEIPAACGIHFDADGRLATFIPRDSGGHTMNVEIIEMPAMRVGTIRHIGPYNQIQEAFARLGAVAGPAGLFSYPGAAMLGIYHDDPETTAPADLRSDAAIVVADDVPLPAELGEQRLPAGRYAQTVHVGPYSQLGDTWARFMGEWLPASGERIGASPSFEIYRNTPETAAPDDLRTEMYVPLV